MSFINRLFLILRNLIAANKLVTMLLLPLVGISVLGTFFAYFYNGQLISSLWLNISTDTLGIIITVWYVDKLMTSHEKERWHTVRARIAHRVSAVLLECIPSFLSIFHMDDSFEIVMLEVPDNLQTKSQPDKFRLLKIDKKAFSAKGFSDDLVVHPPNANKLRALTEQLNQVSKLIDTFFTQLEPDTLDDLIGVQGAYQFVLRFYRAHVNRSEDRESLNGDIMFGSMGVIRALVGAYYSLSKKEYNRKTWKHFIEKHGEYIRLSMPFELMGFN